MDEGVPKYLTKTVECKHGITRCINFNKDGNYCITGGTDNRISLWNPYSGTCLKTYSGHAGEVTDAIATTDNSQIASGSDDKMVMLWDVTTGVSTNRWRKHLGRVNSIALNDESNIIISAGIDKHVYAWDRRAKNINPVQSMNEARDSVVGVDSHKWFIVTASLDGSMRTYDLRKGQMTEDYVGKLPTTVRQATDCHLLLVSCSDDTVRLFDHENGGLLQRFTGHSNEDYRIQAGFTLNNAYVVSGSANRFVHIWSLLTAQYVHKFQVPLLKAGTRVATTVVHSVVAHPTKSEYLLAVAGDHFFLYSATDPGQ